MSLGRISPNSSPNITAMMRNSAISKFEQNKKTVKEQEAELQIREEENKAAEVTAEKAPQNKEMQEMTSQTSKKIEEIKNLAQGIGEELSDEDIKYALRYGRSVLVDYSA